MNPAVSVQTEIEELKALVASLTDQGSQQEEPQAHYTVEQWKFGAKVFINRSGIVEVVKLALPPKVGRFPIPIYNKIVELINLNAKTLAAI